LKHSIIIKSVCIWLSYHSDRPRKGHLILLIPMVKISVGHWTSVCRCQKKFMYYILMAPYVKSNQIPCVSKIQSSLTWFDGFILGSSLFGCCYNCPKKYNLLLKWSNPKIILSILSIIDKPTYITDSNGFNEHLLYSTHWSEQYKFFACAANIIDGLVFFWLLACVGQMIIRILAHLSSLIFKIITMQISFFVVNFTQTELRWWNTPAWVWALQKIFLWRNCNFSHILFTLF